MLILPTLTPFWCSISVGVDDSSAQQLYARHVYSWRDISWRHRYKDITSVSPQGRFLLDYSNFNEVVAEEDASHAAQK